MTKENGIYLPLNSNKNQILTFNPSAFIKTRLHWRFHYYFCGSLYPHLSYVYGAMICLWFEYRKKVCRGKKQPLC
jgi:hypothetical protein